MKESVYLFNKENRDFYQDLLKKENQQDCLFSRNLFAYLERGSEATSPFYEKHLMECSTCQSKAARWEELLKVVDRSVVEEKMEPNTLEFLESECHSLADLFNQKREKERRNRRKEALAAIQTALNDLFKVSYHPNMLKAVLVAFVSGYILSLIL